MNFRTAKGTVMMAVCGSAALFSAGMLLYIIAELFIKGAASLNLQFILATEAAAGHAFGTGIANALVGTLLLSITSTLIALPFAVGTAIYLKKYAPDNHLTRFLRLMIEVLSGTPSIVLGIFGMLVLVVYLKPLTGGLSLLAGSLALAALILPVIERATEDAIARIPQEFEEGSYALGATMWLTIRNIILPCALPGIIVGAILGFGRAAEESAVVLLTAGYSQYIPPLGITPDPQYLLGIKISPLNNLVGSMPAFIYTSYENSNVFPISSVFATGFVLVCLVMLINISAKTILFYATASMQGHTGNIGTSVFTAMAKYLRQKDLGKTEPCEQVPTEENIPGYTAFPVSSNVPDPLPPSDTITGSPIEETPLKGPQSILQSKLHLIFEGIRNRLRKVHRNRPVPSPPSQPILSVLQKEKPKPALKFGHFIRTFLLSLAPFALIAGVLLVFSLVLPGSGTGLSAGSGTYIALLIIMIVAGAVCTFAALFLRRLLLRSLRKKYRLPTNRAGTTAALGAGICIVFACAFLFSAHAVQPDSGTGGPAGSLSGLANPLSLFGLGNSTAQEPVNRTAQLAALLAEEGDDGTGSTPYSAASSSAPVVETIATTPAAAAVTPSVPLKDALSLREIYQYGNPNRRCLATVYNTTVLPFYFWWLIDYNRFVPQTPGTGNQTIVVFIRIENDGNKSAIVPSADAIVLTYKGTTYTHQPYFNTSYLSDWQIEYYESHLDKLPYQWIREIGAMKRDYAYLTGYNIFGENLTRTDNLTEVPDPGFDINGKGYFIQPGDSNAIDGYLIYYVPDAVANDLQNAYLQVAFNSISSTRWRLGT